MTEMRFGLRSLMPQTPMTISVGDLYAYVVYILGCSQSSSLCHLTRADMEGDGRRDSDAITA